MTTVDLARERRALDVLADRDLEVSCFLDVASFDDLDRRRRGLHDPETAGPCQKASSSACERRVVDKSDMSGLELTSVAGPSGCHVKQWPKMSSTLRTRRVCHEIERLLKAPVVRSTIPGPLAPRPSPLTHPLLHGRPEARRNGTAERMLLSSVEDFQPLLRLILRSTASTRARTNPVPIAASTARLAVPSSGGGITGTSEMCKGSANSPVSGPGPTGSAGKMVDSSTRASSESDDVSAAGSGADDDGVDDADSVGVAVTTAVASDRSSTASGAADTASIRASTGAAWSSPTVGLGRFGSYLAIGRLQFSRRPVQILDGGPGQAVRGRQFVRQIVLGRLHDASR